MLSLLKCCCGIACARTSPILCFVQLFSFLSLICPLVPRSLAPFSRLDFYGAIGWIFDIFLRTIVSFLFRFTVAVALLGCVSLTSRQFFRCLQDKTPNMAMTISCNVYLSCNNEILFSAISLFFILAPALLLFLFFSFFVDVFFSHFSLHFSVLLLQTKSDFVIVAAAAVALSLDLFSFPGPGFIAWCFIHCLCSKQ